MNDALAGISTEPAAEAFAHRYREQPRPLPRPWNEVLRTQLDHRSVRSYLASPISEETLELLVAAAQSAPTSSNLQAWSVVAVRDVARKAELARLAGGQAHIVQAPLVLVWIADLSRITRIAAAQGVELEGADFTESFLLATIDAALAAQNAVVAAESLGLGTVYIGALRNHPLEVAALLELPERAFAVFGLVVGHPDPARPADIKPRLPQAAVLHHEVYDAEAQVEAVRRHDAHSLAFRAEQGLDATPWSAQAIQRLRTVASLMGRHVLRQAVAKLGFPLK
ncbi:NADPH-dependent oxidoreductase [Azorhizobium oxalatiphilum]|uniref:NADPH-dependent oxidoreductase n=1 Tax=Azorhizobium oxalatiphilum TaxID=980631 RepID=A0A917CBH3_9HYPH|nr:NADPH-dependent oxidoreductase [Azorhizobium oxalatiphilum]GGF82523.1 NADPH-dependent oxidoreductase [Azorhizobium oxalatiphilum]